jgi:hypothetical protein
LAIFWQHVNSNGFGTNSNLSQNEYAYNTHYYKPNDIRLTMGATIIATNNGPIALPVLPPN